MLKRALAPLMIVAGVAAGAATSHADTCRDGGHSLATVTHWTYTGDVKAPQKLASKLEVLDTGAWTLDTVDDKGRFIKRTAGCLAAADLAALRTAVAAADWKLADKANACDYASAGYVEYGIAGKHAWNGGDPCSIDMLDDVSKQALAALDAADARAQKQP